MRLLLWYRPVIVPRFIFHVFHIEEAVGGGCCDGSCKESHYGVRVLVPVITSQLGCCLGGR